MALVPLPDMMSREARSDRDGKRRRRARRGLEAEVEHLVEAKEPWRRADAVLERQRPLEAGHVDLSVEMEERPLVPDGSPGGGVVDLEQALVELAPLVRIGEHVTADLADEREHVTEKRGLAGNEGLAGD